MNHWLHQFEQMPVSTTPTDILQRQISNNKQAVGTYSTCTGQQQQQNNNKQRDLLQGVNNIQITAQLHIPYTNKPTNTGQKCNEQLIPAAVLISLGLNWQLDYEKQWNKSGWCSRTVKRQICRMCVFIKQKSITKKMQFLWVDWTGLDFCLATAEKWSLVEVQLRTWACSLNH